MPFVLSFLSFFKSSDLGVLGYFISYWYKYRACGEDFISLKRIQKRAFCDSCILISMHIMEASITNAPKDAANADCYHCVSILGLITFQMWGTGSCGDAKSWTGRIMKDKCLCGRGTSDSLLTHILRDCGFLQSPERGSLSVNYCIFLPIIDWPMDGC
jgi:hypothetical protein